MHGMFVLVPVGVVDQPVGRSVTASSADCNCACVSAEIGVVDEATALVPEGCAVVDVAIDVVAD